MDKLHKLLQRQCARVGIDIEHGPTNSKDWQTLLNKISNAYADADQERYLLERSMNLSSEELSELHQQLLTTARRAGMADVATSILHNVGNVLNSANISLELINQSFNNQHQKNFFSIMELIKLHKENINEFLIADEKGKFIPKFILSLMPYLEDINQTMKMELANLTEQLDHIKKIVSMQQGLGGVSGFNEKFILADVIHTAIKMSGLQVCPEIKLTVDFKLKAELFNDKNKILQILLNLIQNAKDAVQSKVDSTDKYITISVSENLKYPNMILVCIEDNGIGIAKENVDKVFTFGFTTKKNGHGFGLHSSALAAREVGGRLWAESEGEDKGAILNLTLPI